MPPVKTILPISIVVIVILALGVFVWWKWFDTYHLATVQPGVLYRDGVRSMHSFELAYRKVNFKTVVALIDDDEIRNEPFASEMAFCKDHGIDVIRVPIRLGGWPAGEQVKQFLAVAGDPAREPVLVHCAQGVRRTGMMVAAYQESVLGFDKDRSKSAMLTFGHSQRTVGDVQRFIDVYDPKDRVMTVELEMSKE